MYQRFWCYLEIFNFFQYLGLNPHLSTNRWNYSNDDRRCALPMHVYWQYLVNLLKLNPEWHHLKIHVSQKITQLLSFIHSPGHIIQYCPTSPWYIQDIVQIQIPHVLPIQSKYVTNIFYLYRQWAETMLYRVSALDISLYALGSWHPA